MICITSHKYKIREQSPVEIVVGISEVSAFLDWTLDRVWPLEALKREQASRVTLPTLLLVTAHCSPADIRRCSHNSGHTITSIGVRRREEAAANISGMLRLIPDM